MLRAGLVAFGLVLTGIGLALLAAGDAFSARTPLIFGVIVLIAVLCERWRYRKNEHRDFRQWQPTGEKFEDPETGRTIEVFYDPVSGERRYAPQGDHRTSPLK
ncbi:MAG TPA: hypothetical protein VJ955_06975 [Desulfuromonadales bacterium]|nr:hypothetical protein [Desulfuromonadales bacterium]